MEESRFTRALNLTKILQQPIQKIATFWNTQVQYYIISPLNDDYCILRQGEITCEKPVIITPNSIQEMYQGFSDEEKRFAESLSQSLTQQIRVLGYQFKLTNSKEENIAGSVKSIQEKILLQNENKVNLIAIAEAPKDIWKLSLLKIFLGIVQKSVPTNVQDFSERGFFRSEAQKIEDEIEALIIQAKEDKYYVKELAQMLEDNHLFEKYEDRFFSIVNNT